MSIIMKRILILLLGLFSVAYGQFSPTSAKTAFKWGVSIGTRDSTAYAANDSLVVVINRQGRMMYRSTDGYWKLLANAASSDFVPYTGAVTNVNLGNYRLTARSLKTDSIYANSSAGMYLTTNTGTAVAHWGGGGSVEVDFKGFAGYDANRASSYTARSFTDKNYVDSIAALKPSGSATSGQVTYWNGTNSVTGSSSFTWNNSLLSMGIRNSAAPLAPIHVGNRNVNNSSDAQILISREIDNTISGNGHGFSDASNFNRSGNAAYNSFDGRIDISGSNNYDHYVAFQHGPVNNSTGTISYVSGLSTILTTNSGVVDQNYGVLALNPAGTGQINKNYGVFIAPMRAGIENYGLYSVIADSTNRWNIYSVGTAPNFFEGYVGIGSVNTVNANLRINRRISGASSAYSVWQTGVVQSGVTGAAAGFLNQLNTAAASFTLSNYRHYHASQSTIGASSTVQTQTGFFADETITGGSVRNLGFFGNIASSNGRYNAFMNGTARNFFRGNTLIGDTVLYAGTPNFSVTGKAYVSDSINAGSIRRIGGTSSQYLMADGSTYSFGGTTNTIPKFTGTSSLGNSSITDNGTAVRIASNTEIFGYVSLGTTPNTTRSFNVNTAISGSGSSAGGVYQVGTVQSGTSIAYGFFNNAATQATSFNLPEYTHYFARQNALGAGSSITNQNGFYVSATLIDATNNYGFRGEIPSGTNRWNLFMNGTANNYLEGDLLVGTSTPDGNKLLVNGGIKGFRTTVSSLFVNKDSIPITTSNVWAATIDTITGRMQRINLRTNPTYGTKIIGTSSTPSISGGSSSFIGTGASTSVVGNDMAGTATLTTGTGCGSTGASNEAAFTVTFASAYTTAPIVLIQAVQRGGLTSTDGPVNNLFFLRRSNAGTTGFTVYIPVGTTLTDSTTYDIFYHVIGK